MVGTDPRQQLRPDRLGIGIRLEVEGQPGRALRAVVPRERRPVHDHEAPVTRIVVVDRGHLEWPSPLRCVELDAVVHRHVVLDREALGHHHGIGANRAAHGGAPVRRGLEQQPPMLEQHLEVSGAQDDQITVRSIRQIDVAEPIERGDGGMGRESSLGGCRDRDRRAERRPVRRRHEEVALQRLTDPVANRVAKAADHDGNGRQHRQTDHQRRHRHRQP